MKKEFLSLVLFLSLSFLSLYKTFHICSLPLFLTKLIELEDLFVINSIMDRLTLTASYPDSQSLLILFIYLVEEAYYTILYYSLN